MEKNKELQLEVVEELDWDPQVNAANIGVTVEDGVVTLSGNVSSYFEKVSAEQAVKRVAGVKAVAEELEVKLPALDQRSDSDIARSVLDALKWNVAVPEQHIDVKVEHGWVTLQGEVDWYYQKLAAQGAVERLAGVKGITNLIFVRPTVSSAEIKSKIEDAFKRNALLDAEKITINILNGKVSLHGKVQSWQEREQAELAATAAPGVREVDNDLKVDLD